MKNALSAKFHNMTYNCKLAQAACKVLRKYLILHREICH